MTNHSYPDHATLADQFSAAGVIPVIALADIGRAVELATVLVEAGLPVLEVTLRNERAVEAIERMAKEVKGAMVGAGTVLNDRQLAEVAAAGARFAVSPGATGALYRAAARGDMPPLIPGVATASEVMLGLDHGHQFFKFFPAAAAGGPALLRAWHGPFARARFMPTGGIGPDQAEAYLNLPNVTAIGGSWMLPRDAVTSGDWTKIQSLASAAAKMVALAC